MTDDTIPAPGPRRIGRYLVEAVLGEGAMGVVYRARDPDIDRPVAVKVIREAGLGPALRQAFDDRFRREARAAGRIHRTGRRTRLRGNGVGTDVLAAHAPGR